MKWRALGLWNSISVVLSRLIISLLSVYYLTKLAILSSTVITNFSGQIKVLLSSCFNKWFKLSIVLKSQANVMNNVGPMPISCTTDCLIFTKVDSFPRNVVACILLERNEIHLIIKVGTLHWPDIIFFLSILHDPPCEEPI